MSADVTLLRPLWLAGLPLLAAFAWWVWTRQKGAGDWDRAADPAFIQAMTVLGRVEAHPGHRALWAGLTTFAICVLALSGPAIERRDTPSFRNLDGVLFLVDTSPNVTEHPEWPKLLGLGRYGLASLGTRPAGIIVYAGDAYLASGMTVDHLQLGQTFSLIGADLVPDPGTRPARALAMAIEQLEQASIVAGDVILFTDGSGFGQDTLEQASRLPEIGARLSVVSFETSDNLKAHAAAGEGRVFNVEEAEGFAAWISEDQRTRLERQDFPLILWVDMGRYLLLVAALPMLLLFRRSQA